MKRTLLSLAIIFTGFVIGCDNSAECSGEPIKCYRDYGMCCTNGDFVLASCIEGNWRCSNKPGYECYEGHSGLILPTDPDFITYCCTETDYLSEPCRRAADRITDGGMEDH